MSKVVFDSDGLIKMAKSGVLEVALEHLDSYISQEVFDEVITEGKNLQFEDANVIEELIKKNKVKIQNYSIDKGTQETLERKHLFGPGEKSSIHLCNSLKADAIVSDDQKFLKFLKEEKVSFIMPVDLIYKIYEEKKINKEQALSSLQKIKHLVKIEVFEKVETKIKEDEK